MYFSPLLKIAPRKSASLRALGLILDAKKPAIGSDDGL
jgi:hypothetical protein